MPPEKPKTKAEVRAERKKQIDLLMTKHLRDEKDPETKDEKAATGFFAGDRFTDDEDEEMIGFEDEE